MKNILIHCAMEKEGEQIAKFLELSKVQKYDTNLKNNSIKESKEKFNKTDINNFIEVYSNKVNDFADVYLNDKNSNLQNVENNIYTENKTKSQAVPDCDSCIASPILLQLKTIFDLLKYRIKIEISWLSAISVSSKAP